MFSMSLDISFSDQGRTSNMFETQNLDSMQLDTSEMELDSSRKMLPELQNFQAVSSSKHTITRSGNESRLKTNNVPADYMVKHHHLVSKLRNEGASSSKEAVKKCGIITRHHPGSKAFSISSYSKGKVVLQESEAEEVNRRLEILEEENEILKQAFLETAMERKKLVNEINQLFHFQKLRYSIQPEDQNGNHGSLTLTIKLSS